MKPDWETVAGRVGHAFVGPVRVDVEEVVDLRVVVTVWAVGVARETVLVRSRREIRVVVVVFVEGGFPGQRGREVGRGGMCGLR